MHDGARTVSVALSFRTVELLLWSHGSACGTYKTVKARCRPWLSSRKAGYPVARRSWRGSREIFLSRNQSLYLNASLSPTLSLPSTTNPPTPCSPYDASLNHEVHAKPSSLNHLCIVKVGGDDGEFRPWHYIHVCSIESRLRHQASRKDQFVALAKSSCLILNPRPQTLNSQPQTSNPKPLTLKPETINPKP